MKLSFSTRGRYQTSWREFVTQAAENRFGGIEIYDPEKYPSFSEKGGPFHKYSVAQTVRELADLGLSIPCVDTRYDLGGEDCTARLSDMIRLASELGAPTISACAYTDDEDRVRRTFAELLPAAEKAQVRLLVSTKGIYSDTARLRSLLDGFASDYAAVLWDFRSPCLEQKETPAQTIKNLGAYVKHVHVRDYREDGGLELVGEGILPLEEIMRALSSVDYDGFLSLEWNPVWAEEDVDSDILYPYYVNYMNRFRSTRGGKKELYYNFDGTGQFIWKQDELIDLTFSRVLDRTVEEFPDQYAFRYTTLDYTRTYREFSEDVDDFARALISMGVRPGSRVAIWATNVPEWFIAFWSVTKIGAVLVSMNTAYKVSEAEYLLHQSDTHTLIMIESCRDSDYRGIITELCPEIRETKAGEPLHCKRLPFLRNVITVGFSMPGCLTFEEACERRSTVPMKELRRLASQVRPDDVCNMQYTSGTTGFPKGVMLTHYNVINNGKCIGDRMGLSTADRMMIQVPMFHCFGMVLSMTASMTHGTTLCPLPYFSARSSLACINQEKITCFNGVPTMFIAMFNHPDYRRTDFSHMRTGIMAGAGCPPELMKRAARPDEMNMRGIVSVYGQTESSPGSTMSAWTDTEEVRCDTVGYAFPHVLCKVVDPETGKELETGQIGEFCSKGYNTMKGYYKMPDATRDTVDGEGWLHSGDLCRKDEKGCYTVTGRLKDMIIRGGENIYPKEIEEFIYTHPAVQDVTVIGVPDKTYGEEALAAIILKKDETVTEEEMRAYITANIARHKVPKYIRFTDSFPMNAAGKILKYKMREEFAKQI